MFRLGSRFSILFTLLACGLAAAEPVDFVRDVQPIFERACAGCHGEAQQLGQLRLDSKQSVFHGGVSQGIVKPGEPDASALYIRIAGLNDQPRMPMGGELPAEEIALVKRWIAEGAVWPDAASKSDAKVDLHWAFLAPARPAEPGVKNSSWVRNPIDRFVLAKLEKEGLAPSPEADRVTLLRRLSLDLIGLPPTPEEVDAFLADRSPDAYQKQVRRLLDSPHYGEKWGRTWLDAARYADSDGFEKDKPRDVWFYRDWVINAFNQDMGYDQFVIEQVAGDLLPDATQAQRVATGFLRNSMINEEGGIDPEQFRMEAMFDRMDALGKSILGLTIQCAQCHNHKFDPLTQADYYSVFAFLNNSYEANVTVYTPEEHQRRAEMFAEIDAVERAIQRANPDWEERLEAWAARVRDDQPAWRVLRPEVIDMSTGGQKYLPLEDGSFLAQGYAPTKHTVQMPFTAGEAETVSAVRLELLNHANLPRTGPGRSIYGTGALTEIEIYVSRAGGDPDKPEKLEIRRATADINPPETPLQQPYLNREPEKDKRITGPVAFAIDDDANTAWSIDAGPGRRNQPRKAVFELAEPVDLAQGDILEIRLSQRHGGWNSDDNQNNNLGRFRLSVTDTRGVEADPLPAAVREIVSKPVSTMSDAERARLFRYWRTTVPDWGDANARIETLWAKHPEGSTQLVMQEREQRRPTHRLERGDFLKPAEVITPAPPKFLHAAIESQEPARLRFARWLVDDGAPTTARSIVNRIWQGYFGIGIVETVEDLGTQSPDPSHPELLDWLAVELMDQGWSLKRIHETIVTSATYRQTSRTTPELLERDPYNRLLARGPRFRVDAEVVRDIALAASGLLNDEVGGPSVYPPAPDFLFQPPASYGPKIWETEKGEDRYRRAVYTFRYRSVPYPALDVFDAPNGDAACVRRARSNTPLQALTTLNETVFLEAARALAFQAIAEGGETDRERLELAFRRCLARKPDKAEAEELLALLERTAERYSTEQLDPWAMLDASPAFRGRLPGGVTAAEAAAWTAVSRVLLNLDETITKE